MKLKSNIYHVTADNGERYEDFTGYSVTVHARTFNDAIKKGLAEIAKTQGWKDSSGLFNADAKLVFENVEMNCLAPEPFSVSIDETDFTYDFERQEMEVKAGYERSTIQNVRALRDYLNELWVRIEATEAL